MKTSLPADIVIKEKEQRSRSKLSDAGPDYMTVFRRLTENLIRLAGAKEVYPADARTRKENVI